MPYGTTLTNPVASVVAQVVGLSRGAAVIGSVDGLDGDARHGLQAAPQVPLDQDLDLGHGEEAVEEPPGTASIGVGRVAPGQ